MYDMIATYFCWNECYKLYINILDVVMLTQTDDTYRYFCYIMVVLYMSMGINGKAVAVLGNSICGQCLSMLTNLAETAGGQTAGSILFILPSFAPQVSDTFLS